jgi:hypothetical protein
MSRLNDKDCTLFLNAFEINQAKSNEKLSKEIKEIKELENNLRSKELNPFNEKVRKTPSKTKSKTKDKDKDKYKKVRRFLYSTRAKENREFITQRAYKGLIKWKYFIPLEDVVNYLSFHHKLDPKYEADRNKWIKN